MSAELPPVSSSDMTRHSGLVALTLATVARLQREFFETSSQALQSALLETASVVLDRTLPDESLKTTLSAVSPDKHVQALVEHRSQLSAVPPRFWRATSVSPSSLGQENYRGFRAVDRILRRDNSNYELAWPIALRWLEQELVAYPQLDGECRALCSLDC